MTMWSVLHIATLFLQLASLAWLLVMWRPNRSSLTFWSPLAIVGTFFGIYFILGPVIGTADNASEHLGRNFTELLPLGWVAGAVGVTAITSGFVLVSDSRTSLSQRALPHQLQISGLKSFAYALLLLGFVGTVLWITLGDIGLTVAAIEIGSEVGGIGEGAARVNYLYHTINFFIAAALILFVEKRKLTVLILLITVLAVTFYAAVGFRYRIALLLLGLYVLYHLIHRRTPNLLFLAASSFLAFLLMGTISRYRTYWGGLRLDSQEDTTLWDLLIGALGETNTFYGLCAVLDAVPNPIDFAYFNPLLYVFILPIPRFIWPEKPNPDYLQKVYESIGTADAWSAGTAVPSIGEYYLAFGWPGIVLGGLLFGMLLGWIWRRFLRNIHDPRWNVLYALFFPFFYYMMSRGYLAQLVQDFVFTLGPALAMFVFCKPHKQIQRSPTSSHG